MIREKPIKITEDMPLETARSLAKEQINKIYGPLTKSLWFMHQIIIKAMLPLPSKGDVLIRVNEEGEVYMVPEAYVSVKQNVKE